MLEQPLQVVRVLELKSLQRRSARRGELAALVDRLVRTRLHVDRARACEHRNHGHVDQGDRRQNEGVLGAEQLGKALFDLRVENRATEQARPARVRSPLLQVRRDRVDDLALEVEAEVVARGEVGEPLVADADHSTVQLVDDGIRHRVRPLELGQVVAGGEPLVDPDRGHRGPGDRCARSHCERIGGSGQTFRVSLPDGRAPKALE